MKTAVADFDESHQILGKGIERVEAFNRNIKPQCSDVFPQKQPQTKLSYIVLKSKIKRVGKLCLRIFLSRLNSIPEFFSVPVFLRNMLR